ncbi:MAG: hypothetical protein GXO25_03265 [Euryarchaeota archaeon]|nr:hypothetical protein [Euryarchaeota archaeon]
MEHLMYHKALLDSDVDLDYYLQLAEEVKEGVHLSARNPVDRAVALVFELVMQEKLNPWKIDMMSFVKMYLDRIRSEKEIDFIIAGKIIYMAWNVLMKKSEQVLEQVHEEEYEVDMFGMDLDAFDFDAYSPPMEVVSPPDIQLHEPVRREETRPVSLFDLIEAIHEVKLDIEKKKKKRKIREKFKFNLAEKVHKEDLEEEIKQVWERLCEVHGEEVPLSLVYDGTRDDYVTVFISLLFLEKFGKVELQQYVPYEEIFIKIKVPEEMRRVEFMPAPEISIEQL